MTPRPAPSAAAAWTAGTAYVAGYVLLDAFSFVQPLLKLGITPWNPQAGLTVAYLLWRGWREAPWVALAALLAELLVRGATAPLGVLAVASLAIAGGYGGLARVLSARCLRFPLETRRDAALLVLGGGATALVVALAYVAVFVAAGPLPLSGSSAAVARYWVGDVNGIITLTPLLLAVHRSHRLPGAVRAHGALCAAQVALLLSILVFVFGQPRGQDMQFVYLLFVPVVWISLTWGLAGATAATLVVQLGLMIGAQRGLSAASVVEIQLLLVTLATTALLMGAVVAERARALEVVAAREAEQRALLAGAPDAVVSTDTGGRITSVNPAGVRLFGRDDAQLIGVTAAELLAGLVLAPRGGRHGARVQRRSGDPIPVDVAWVPIEPPARPGYLLVIRDVSEREHAQAQLRERDTALARAMRFALAGELATALTHELNQPITALVSYVRAVDILSQPIADRDPRLAETLSKVGREALRAADVLKRLRDFYRTGSSALGPVDLRSMVQEVVDTYGERAAALDVDVSWDCATASSVVGDRIQLQMVLHNLISNALDALAMAPAPRRLALHVREKDGIELLVEDNGPGVSPELLDRLFEPFVTDKSAGMGLGLAISHSLMRAQGGALRLDRTGPGGTRFVVQLPTRALSRAAA